MLISGSVITCAKYAIDSCLLAKLSTMKYNDRACVVYTSQKAELHTPSGKLDQVQFLSFAMHAYPGTYTLRFILIFILTPAGSNPFPDCRALIPLNHQPPADIKRCIESGYDDRRFNTLLQRRHS